MTFFMFVTWSLLGLAFIFLSLSVSIFLQTKKMKQSHSVQKGRIVYADLYLPERSLFSKQYRITGKPDYIVKQREHLIPVEVKTGFHGEPGKHHIMQLAAYCQLVEENYGEFTPYGILVYYDTHQQFSIPFNPQLRFELATTIAKMREVLKTGLIERNHENGMKCKNCSMRKYCHMKLT